MHFKSIYLASFQLFVKNLRIFNLMVDNHTNNLYVCNHNQSKKKKKEREKGHTIHLISF